MRRNLRRLAPNAPYKDPHWANVELLLHCDGTNGSTTVPDSSANGTSQTCAGNAQLTTTNPRSGTACLTGDGTGDLVTIGGTFDHAWGTGDFTIEFWLKTTQTTRFEPCGQNSVYGAEYWGFIFNMTSSGDMRWAEDSGASRINTTGVNHNDGQWHHIAVSRDGSNVRMFCDGIQRGSTGTSTFNFGTNISAVLLARADNANHLNGQMDEIRFTKGVARYKADFQVPTMPFPNS